MAKQVKVKGMFKITDASSLGLPFKDGEVLSIFEADTKGFVILTGKDLEGKKCESLVLEAKLEGRLEKVKTEGDKNVPKEKENKEVVKKDGVSN